MLPSPTVLITKVHQLLGEGLNLLTILNFFSSNPTSHSCRYMIDDKLNCVLTKCLIRLF